MDEVIIKIREVHKDNTYWLEYFTDMDRKRNNLIEKIRTQEEPESNDDLAYPEKVFAVQELIEISTEYLIALYSVGYSKKSLQKVYLEIIDYIREFIRLVYTPLLGYEDSNWVFISDWTAFNLASIAVCIDAPIKEAREMCQFMQYQHSSPFFGKICSYFQIQAHSFPEKNLTKKINKVIEQPNPTLQKEELQNYMTNWYQDQEEYDYAWYDSHDGLSTIYFGYWAFEVAAVVIMLDLDDSSFRDHEYYPKDFADSAKQLKT